jgi:hypothetical protein
VGENGVVRRRAILAALVLVLVASGALRSTRRGDEVPPGWETRASKPEDFEVARTPRPGTAARPAR